MKPVAAAVSVALALALPAAAQDSGGTGAAPLGAEESAALEAAGAPGLEGLRAAAFGTDSRLTGAERVVLRDVALRNPDLESLRAGELNLSDREVKIILITAACVVVLALIL